MPKRFSRRTRRLTRLAVMLQVDVDKYAATARAMGRVSDSLESNTAAVLDFLNSKLVADIARELSAKVAPVQLAKFTSITDLRAAVQVGLDDSAAGKFVELDTKEALAEHLKSLAAEAKVPCSFRSVIDEMQAVAEGKVAPVQRRPPPWGVPPARFEDKK